MSGSGESKTKEELENERIFKAFDDRLIKEKEYRDKSEKENYAHALKQFQIEQAIANAKIQSAIMISDALSGLFEQGTAEQKAFALTSIAIDTASAIGSLTSSSEANPLNSVTYGGAGIIQFAAGLVRIIANIASAKRIISSSSNKAATKTTNAPRRVLSDGGAVDIGGNLHTSGGTTFQGSDGTTFEAERGEKLFVVNRKSSKMLSALAEVNNYGRRNRTALRSNYLADGGFVARQSFSNVQTTVQNQQLQDLMLSFASRPVITQVSELQRVTDKVALNKAKATF